jgi:WG containing repeat
MYKSAILIFLIFRCLDSLFAQLDTSSLRTTLLLEAKKAIIASYNNDMETALAYTPPEILQSVGGKEGVRKEMQKAGKNKLTFISSPVTDLQITAPRTFFLENNIVQCAFRYSAKIKLADSITSIHSNIIGMTDETLKKWYFLEVKTMPLEMVRMVISQISDKLVYLPDEQIQMKQEKMEWAIPPFLEAKSLESYNEKYGQVIFVTGDYIFRRNDKSGLASFDGTIIHPAKYSTITAYDEAIYLIDSDLKSYVAKRDNPKELKSYSENKSLLTNTLLFPSSGHKVVQQGADTFCILNQNNAQIKKFYAQSVRMNGKYLVFSKGLYDGLLNENGKEMIPADKYRHIGVFYNGQSASAILGEPGKDCIIDTLGQVLNCFEDLEISGFYRREWHFQTSSKTKIQSKGIVDKNGIQVVSPQYKTLKIANGNYAVFAVEIDDKWTIFNFKEEKLFNEKFDHVDFLDQYVLTVHKKNQKVDVYDLSNLKLVKTFTIGEGFSFAQMHKDEKTSRVFVELPTELLSEQLLPLDGEPLLEENTSDHELLYGLIRYQQNRKFGLIRTNGEELIEPIFDGIEYFAGSNVIWAKQDGKWGMLKIKP